MEKIILKKILSDNPRTYGDEIEFTLSKPLTQATENSSNYSLSTYAYKGSNPFQEGTDLNSLNAVAGDRFQAFKTDGQILGFIISYHGYARTGEYDRNLWLVYNEEIQCFCMYALSRTDQEQLGTFLCINERYLDESETLEGSLKKAELIYNSKYEPFREGMDTNKWNFLQFAYKVEENGVFSYYTQEEVEKYALALNPKMRYFSSWYKLITGKFYQEDKLFAMKMSNGEKFYFGRILGVTERNGCVTSDQISNYTSQLEQDPSYGYTDVIFGTSIAYITPNWGTNVEFDNGLRLGFNEYVYHSNYSRRYGYASFKKLSTSGDLEMRYRIRSLGRFDTDTDGSITFFTSQLLALLSKVNAKPTVFTYEVTSLATEIFVSPEYNNVPYENFNEQLLLLEHSEKEWQTMMARVFTFVDFVASNAPKEMRDNFGYYAGGSNDYFDSTFAYNGWSYFGQTYMDCTGLYDGDAGVYNNFTSPEAWADIISFVNPVPDPEPEPEPEPTPTKKDRKRLTVGDLAKMAIKNGKPLLGDTEKLQPFAFMSGYLEDFELFDEDLCENRGFFLPLWNIENGSDEEVLEHFRKRSAFTIKKHKTEIEGFKAIDDARWNPIENYDRYEEILDKKYGTDTLRDAIDAVRTTYSYGEQAQSNTKGSQSNMQTIGERTGDTTNSVAGFNSSDFQGKEKSTSSESSQNNSSIEGERIDNISVEAHEDIHNTAFREDVHEQTYDNSLTRTAHIHGNIGVTTATQMLEEAKEFYSKWNFYNKLFDLILRELTVYNDQGYDVMF